MLARSVSLLDKVRCFHLKRWPCLKTASRTYVHPTVFCIKIQPWKKHNRFYTIIPRQSFNLKYSWVLTSLQITVTDQCNGSPFSWEVARAEADNHYCPLWDRLRTYSWFSTDSVLPESFGKGSATRWPQIIYLIIEIWRLDLSRHKNENQI